MKNKEILNLKQVVPDNIRLEVYKEALEYIRKGIEHKSNASYFLCLLLPCLLWDLNCYIDNNPEGEDWNMDDITIAFPEVTKEFIYNMHKYSNKITDKTYSKNKRIELLTNAIDNLSKLK